MEYTVNDKEKDVEREIQRIREYEEETRKALSDLSQQSAEAIHRLEQAVKQLRVDLSYATRRHLPMR